MSWSLCHIRCTWVGLLAVAVASSANAQKKYDPGATDTETQDRQHHSPIRARVSAYAMIGKTEAAYFHQAQFRRRHQRPQINFVSYDDRLQPAEDGRAGAQASLESDEVLLIFNPLGTPGNSAIQKYMNAKKVPQIPTSTGAAKNGTIRRIFRGPWAGSPIIRTEARIYGKYISARFFRARRSKYSIKTTISARTMCSAFANGLGDQANKLDRGRIVLRDLLADGGSAGGADQGWRQSRHLRQHCYRRNWWPRRSRRSANWSAPDPLPDQRIGIRRQRCGRLPDTRTARTFSARPIWKDPKDPQWKNDPAMNEAGGLS